MEIKVHDDRRQEEKQRRTKDLMGISIAWIGKKLKMEKVAVENPWNVKVSSEKEARESKLDPGNQKGNELM